MMMKNLHLLLRLMTKRLFIFKVTVLFWILLSSHSFSLYSFTSMLYLYFNSEALFCHLYFKKVLEGKTLTLFLAALLI